MIYFATDFNNQKEIPLGLFLVQERLCKASSTIAGVQITCNLVPSSFTGEYLVESIRVSQSGKFFLNSCSSISTASASVEIDLLD